MSADLHQISLTVNGESHDLLVRSQATLLETMRRSLAMIGPKRGCDHGVCGACTVHLDGPLARSCLTLAVEVDGRQVTTVEGVSGEAEFSAVQKALIDAGAIQCGFCTPGVVMALTALFARNPHPGRDEIRAGLSGHLCRCSGYVKIVEAAERLAAGGDAR